MRRRWKGKEQRQENLPSLYQIGLIDFTINFCFCVCLHLVLAKAGMSKLGLLENLPESECLQPVTL